MKRYYNSITKEWYTEGSTITKKVDNGIFSGIPSIEQLTAWGFTPYTPPQPKEDAREQRMQEILAELDAMDYLTSKYVDGEDMTEYGDWQGKRKALREEYRKLEKEIP